MVDSVSLYQNGMIHSTAILRFMAKRTTAQVNDPTTPDGDDESIPMPGRKRQAARNDGVILDAAREVFLADPKAPVSAVAERAGVGISALYRRYPGKEDLLRTLCLEGLRRYNTEAETALLVADGDDGAGTGWTAFVRFLQNVIEADVHSLTTQLAGTFTPTDELAAEAVRAGQLVTELLEKARESGLLRAGVVVADVGLIQECCAAIRHPDPERTRQLRRRYLALLIDGLTVGGGSLPGPPPKDGEFAWRWQRR